MVATRCGTFHWITKNKLMMFLIVDTYHVRILFEMNRSKNFQIVNHPLCRTDKRDIHTTHATDFFLARFQL